MRKEKKKKGLKNQINQMWGESKLAKMACPDSLAPCFANNDQQLRSFVVLHKHVTRCSLGQGLCAVCICEHHLKKWQHYCCVTAVPFGSATKGENIAVYCSGCCISWERILLWLLCQAGETLRCVRLCYSCCYSCSISQERINVSTAATMAP